MFIKFLSETTINRIAAGEVIERPASVVKELVENAIDAGADNIDIILEAAGKNLIIVSDNGHGISQGDLSIAVQRHTTSKLNEDDLLDINSFGFRGEALPSIGAISKMVITSKHKDAEYAYKIELIGGNVKSPIPTSHNLGTKIEVRDLFFATPARLKFLRTDKTEIAACVDIIKKIALSHPHISFSLINDQKTLFKVRKADESSKNLLSNRVKYILGDDFATNAAVVDFNLEHVSISGYVAIPTYNRASREDQFLFINNRPVKDKLLNIALKIAYQDYLAKDRFPVAVLFINMTPYHVDVNVHPAKNEVRFHDPNLIKNSLISSIRDALATKSQKVSTTIGISAFNLFSKPSIINDSNHSAARQIFTNNTSNLQNNNRVEESKREFKYTPFISLHSPQEVALVTTQPMAKTEDLSKDSEEFTYEQFPLGAAKAQFYNNYIISQTKESIIITDQHAAHERLGYEKIKELMLNNGLIKQRLLMPEMVELPDETRADLIASQKENLFNLGLTVDKFGKNTIIVSEIPSLLGDINIKQLIHDLSDHLLELGANLALIELIEHVTETYACHYSIRAGRSLNVEEMNTLLRQMEDTPFSGQCNHGRPTYVELKLKDIEKLFGRK